MSNSGLDENPKEDIDISNNTKPKPKGVKIKLELLNQRMLKLNWNLMKQALLIQKKKQMPKGHVSPSHSAVRRQKK